MHIPPLEEDIVPLGLLDEVEDVADIQLLLLRSLVVFVNLAQHAHYREKCIFLKLILKF